MEREELLKTKEYWLTKIQTQLFSLVEDYIRERGINRLGFSKELGVSKGYVSQVLNGDYDHRLSKFIDLSLAVGKVPLIEFKDLKTLIEKDKELETGFVYYEQTIFSGRSYIVSDPVVGIFSPDNNKAYSWVKFSCDDIEDAVIYEDNTKSVKIAA